MRVLDLFSGIGGFSLGLERAGMRTVAFCEIDPYCRRVLAKHWPAIPIYDDVRKLTAERLRADGIAVDLICGGFPCQDISTAGKGAGLAGGRSGLWFEFARLIGDVRPRVVIVENVAALLVRGLDRVLADLAALGFDAEWHCIPASAVGAPHRRDRVWIVAYAEYDGFNGAKIRSSARTSEKDWRMLEPQGRDNAPAFMANANGDARVAWRPGDAQQGEGRRHADRGGKREDVADANGAGLAQRQKHQLLGQRQTIERSDWWLVEPDVGRVAHGIPARVDRLRALGNAVIPQVVEMIGRAIMATEEIRP
jgi:DNA (cytosine-5)-methyltransferase 1